MNKIISTIYFTLFSFFISFSQFVDKGQIEFEVKTNMKKTFGSSPWAEMMKDKMPTFKVSYYNLVFANNKSLYKFDHWENKDLIPDMFRKSDEQSIWYTDYNSELSNMQKDVFGTSFNIKDSLTNIEWKLSNENRIIAGYNCKKAVGKILDSVYVFAFYTEEITLPGGPCSINGLPGMILGMTIPRLYTSWIATKINVDNKEINFQEPLANKNVFNRKEAVITIKDRTKDWSNDSDPDSKKWIEQLLWNVML